MNAVTTTTYLTTVISYDLKSCQMWTLLFKDFG